MKISFKKVKFKPVIFSIFIYVLALFVLPYVTVRYLHITDKILVYQLMLIYNLLAAIFLLVYTRKINSIDKTKPNYNYLHQILFGIAGFLVMLMMQIFLSIMLQLLGKIYGFNPTSQNTQEIALLIKQIPIFSIYVVVLAPLLEEIVFRRVIFGYLYDILETKYEVLKFLLSSILAGLIFALPHDGFSPIIIVYVVMSIVFSFMYKITNSVLSSVIAHLLMNFVVVIIQFYFA